MNEEKIISIPGRLKSVAEGTYVAGTEDIYDDQLMRTQKQINSVSADNERTLKSRMDLYDEHVTYSIDGGDRHIATAEDFDYSTAEHTAKIPTVLSILDWSDENVVKTVDQDLTTAQLQTAKQNLGMITEIVHDISLINESDYADVSAAINAIPSALRIGGISIKFSNSTTGKYETWTLTSDSWSDNTADWQGVDDEPTAGSENLVKSGGVAIPLLKIKAKKEIDYINIGSEAFIFDYLCRVGGEEVFGTNKNNAKATNIFPVGKGIVITYKGITCASTNYIIVAYDKDMNVLEDASVVGTGNVISSDTTYTVPENVAFLRICGSSFASYINIKDSRYTAYYEKERKAVLDIQKSTLWEKVNLTPNDFVYRYYVRTNGTEVFDSDSPYNVFSTPFIKVVKGDIFECTRMPSSSSLFGIVAYDKDLNIINESSVIGPSSVSHTKITYTVPENVIFLRFTSQKVSLTSVTNSAYRESVLDSNYLNASIDKSKYIEAGTVLVDNTDPSWKNARFNTGNLSFQLYIKDSLTTKTTLDKIKCYSGKKFKSATNAELVFYNKEGGYCGHMSVLGKTEYTFPKTADTFRIQVTSTNQPNAKVYLSEGIMDDIPEDAVDTIEKSSLGVGVHSFKPNITNGKFRLYTEFTIDEDVNIGADAEDKVLLTLKNGENKIKVFVRKQAVTQLETTVAGWKASEAPNYLCKYPLPDFHSGFGFETTGIVGKIAFESRSLPIWKPLCGEAFLTVRYKGVINSTENPTTHVTTNTTTVKVSVADNSISFNGTVGAGNVSLSKSVAITSVMTADDLAAAINADSTLNEYIEAKAVSYNGDKLVYSQLINCSDIEIVTTSPNAVNAPETDGTSSIACPMYLFSKIDKSKHAIEIMSDGVNARIVVDGQNTGTVWNNPAKGSTNQPTVFLNYDLIPILNENLQVFIGGDENGVDAKITTELVRIDINSNADAEAVANERIISKYNPNYIIMMGHGTWDGPELDGGGAVAGKVSLSDLPEGCVKDSTLKNDNEANVASSTGRLKRIAKMAYELGYEWVDPAEFINAENKKKVICAIFDDFRIDNFYKTGIRQGFVYGMKANYAIENMKNNIPDADEQHKIDYLQMIGWKCFIHGNSGDSEAPWNDKICSLSYEQLYTDDDTVVPSIAHNLKNAVDYNINQMVWIYSGGSQTPNGIMAFKHKGIKIGPMTNIGDAYYVCRAANPLYWKRYNIADKVKYLYALTNQAFLETKLMIITLPLSVTAYSGEGDYTHIASFSMQVDSFMRERIGVVYSHTNSEPTIEDTVAYYDGTYLPANRASYTINVKLVSGVNYIRPFVVYADESINYGEVLKYNV